MSEHYYAKRPTASHDPKRFEAVLRGKQFQFVTDAGVFSRQGVDYGSRLLIESMEIEERSHVLDVGCGYGPIGLTAAVLARFGTATLLDINERAVELATMNAQHNRVVNVKVLQSDLLKAVQGKVFDVILTNPPIRAGKATVHRIFEEAGHCLADNGALWIVIQKKQGAPSAWSKLEQLYADVQEMAKQKGYFIYRARQPLSKLPNK